MGRQPPAPRGDIGASHLSQENPLFRFGVNLECVGDDGKTHLHTAAMFSDAEKVKWLVAEGLDVNAKDDRGATPLHAAVEYMQQPVIRALLDTGAQPDLVDDEGLTPLHLAATHNSSLAPDVISLLLKRGADASVGDKRGRTALHLAVEGNHKDAMEAFLRAGVDVEGADSEGRTLLHLAVGKSARTGCACRVVERFLALGISPNSADSKGQTALHYAALKGVKATTQALLKAGADVLAKDADGNTPQELARTSRHNKLVPLLREGNQGAVADGSPPAGGMRRSPTGAKDKPAVLGNPDLPPATPPESSGTPEARHVTAPSGGGTPDSPESAGEDSLAAAHRVEQDTLRVEMSIRKAQKIQLESLRRQIAELDGVAAEKKALEERLALAVAEHDTEVSELHSEKTMLQAELDAAEDRAKAANRRADDAERRLADAQAVRASAAAAAAQAAVAQREAALSAAAAAHTAALQIQLDAARSELAAAERGLRAAVADHGREVAELHSKLEDQSVRLTILKEAYDDLLALSEVQPDKAQRPAKSYDESFKEAYAALRERSFTSPTPLSTPRCSSPDTRGRCSSPMRSQGPLPPLSSRRTSDAAPSAPSPLPSPARPYPPSSEQGTPHATRASPWAVPLGELLPDPGFAVSLPRARSASPAPRRPALPAPTPPAAVPDSPASPAGIGTSPSSLPVPAVDQTLPASTSGIDTSFLDASSPETAEAQAQAESARGDPQNGEEGLPDVRRDVADMEAKGEARSHGNASVFDADPELTHFQRASEDGTPASTPGSSEMAVSHRGGVGGLKSMEEEGDFMVRRTPGAGIEYEGKADVPVSEELPLRGSTLRKTLSGSGSALRKSFSGPNSVMRRAGAAIASASARLASQNAHPAAYPASSPFPGDPHAAGSTPVNPASAAASTPSRPRFWLPSTPARCAASPTLSDARTLTPRGRPSVDGTTPVALSEASTSTIPAGDHPGPSPSGNKLLRSLGDDIMPPLVLRGASTPGPNENKALRSPGGDTVPPLVLRGASTPGPTGNTLLRSPGGDMVPPLVLRGASTPGPGDGIQVGLWQRTLRSQTTPRRPPASKGGTGADTAAAELRVATSSLSQLTLATPRRTHNPAPAPRSPLLPASTRDMPATPADCMRTPRMPARGTRSSTAGATLQAGGTTLGKGTPRAQSAAKAHGTLIRATPRRNQENVPLNSPQIAR